MTEYIPVSWSKEVITIEKLNRMATNDQALFENKPTAVLRHNGITRARGVKILAGSQLYQPTNTWSTIVDHYFGNYFSAGCQPVVVPTRYGFPQTGASIAPMGLGRTQLPDHRGFSTYVWTDDRKGLKGTLQRPFYIAYIAVGW